MGLPSVMWHRGQQIAQVELRGDEDPSALWGHYAVHHQAENVHHLYRDALGVHKLFYALTPQGEVASDSFLFRLLEQVGPDRVFSVPPGAIVTIDPGERRFVVRRTPQLKFAESGSLEEAAQEIARAFSLTFERLAQSLAGRQVFVTLSGGLDSSCIAALARDVFPGLKAITFRLDDGPLSANEDLAAARKVARHLGIELVEINQSPQGVIELLDGVLRYGQDPRDFSVHCGMVNAAIGRALAEQAPGAVVLTGDGANELMADYSPVELNGRMYYDLPRLDPAGLRRYLVNGLDAGDREAGVFARFGVEVVQPFLLCAQAFAGLPGSCISDRGLKGSLVRSVTAVNEGPDLPDFVFDRPKVRAQCARGGEPGGTMALLARAGLNQAALLERFSTLHGVDLTWMKTFIRRCLPTRSTF